MKFSRTLNAALATVLGGAAISAAQNTIFPANFTSQNVSSIFVLNYHSDDVGGSLQIIGEWKTPVGSSSNVSLSCRVVCFPQTSLGVNTSCARNMIIMITRTLRLAIRKQDTGPRD